MTHKPEDLAGLRRNNLFGLSAILLWSTTVAISRTVIESLGPLTAGAVIHLLAGVVGVGLAVSRMGWKALAAVCRSRGRLAGGGLVVVYLVCLYLALGLAETRAQAVGVGLVNYLWPALTQAFAIPLLGKRARWSLPLGIILALAGAYLAIPGGGLSVNTQAGSLLPYLIMLPGAAAWALYSNLSNKMGGASGGEVMPVFLLAGGVVLGFLRLCIPEPSTWSLPVGLAVIYMGLLPGLLAYSLWELAMQRGSLVLVSSLSYLAPVLSTLAAVQVLDVPLTGSLALAAGLVVAGAVVCRVSLQDPLSR